MKSKARYSAPWARIVLLLAFLAAAICMSKLLFGSFIPTEPSDIAIFQGALLLVLLGSAVIEYRFTKPSDSLINGLFGVMTLITVYGEQGGTLWWIVFGYCALVFIASCLCIVASASHNQSKWQAVLSKYTYRPAITFGMSRVLYSVVFLYAMLSYYDIKSRESVFLLLFWGAFIVMWPLGVPELLTSLRDRKPAGLSIARVLQTEEPNMIRVEIKSGVDWSHSSVKVLHESDGVQRYVVPIRKYPHSESLVGSGLCVGKVESKIDGTSIGCLYEPNDNVQLSSEEIAVYLDGEKTSTLVGFIVEESVIEEIKFEVTRMDLCFEGLLVWCRVGDKRVFYQVVQGLTCEEALTGERRGHQVATAVQLGLLDDIGVFKKFKWIPEMNTPVFVEPENFGKKYADVDQSQFVYGCVPGTKLNVSGDFSECLESHTAILGITGSGKTELAFDLIRKSIGNGIKVVCVDFTRQYESRLSDLLPYDLSLSEEVAKSLAEKIFDADTGDYGAGKEKKILRDNAEKIRADVWRNIKAFMESSDDSKRIGIISLGEVSNTKASIFVTEIFLSSILKYAIENQKSPKILIVLEEAHTIIPEAATMGIGDYDARGMVGKISQIALQGRKYGVGLLIVAQRTATVSKTVLTQCNTIIVFTSYDGTGLSYLENIFGRSFSRAIPNLPMLHAVVFGKGVASERPIIVQIPYDEKKAKLSVKKA